MSAHDPELRRKIAAAGGAARQNRPDAAVRRADAVVASLEAHIRRVVDAAPPLSAGQRDRLAALFATPAAAADRADQLGGAA